MEHITRSEGDKEIDEVASPIFYGSGAVKVFTLRIFDLMHPINFEIVW